MRASVVVDTNVAVVANGKNPKTGPECVLACIRRLQEIQRAETVLIDDLEEILTEYRGSLIPTGQKGPGDAFFKWLSDNQGYEACCRRVHITPHADRGFVEFPADDNMRDFDWDDRKFVAVAIASGVSPEILNAADHDWIEFEEPMLQHGLRVRELCPEHQERKRPDKRQRKSRPKL